MAWKWAALLPHPPIIVPGVGMGRERDAQATIDGSRAVAHAISEMGHTDAVLLLSPHQMWAHDALAINAAPRVKGSLSHFGAANSSFDIETPLDLAEALVSHARKRGARTVFVESEELSSDQGSIVPLYFMREAMEDMPRILLASPIGLERRSAIEYGSALADFDDGLSWGLIASGDLSHRLLPGGSNGYSPSGQIFDDAVVQSVKEVDPSHIMKLTEEEIESAGECGMRSALVMLGLLGSLGRTRGDTSVFSYEGPFGVGYCTAFCRAA